MDACPSTGTLPSGTVRTAQRAAALRGVGTESGPAAYVPGAIAVQYDENADTRSLDVAMLRFNAVHAGDMRYAALHVRMRVVSVDPSAVSDALVAFKSLPGVRSVSRVGYRRRLTLGANDLYYQGDIGTGPPYYETPSTHGQWDMHVINTDGAWSGFGTNVAGAPLAIVDTGFDLTHPELQGGRVTRARCYLTYPAGSAQTAGSYVTDTDGHGTDVAGIADSDTDNAFAFAGTAYNTPLLLYRMFPSDPPAGCESDSKNPQCNADTADEASAIADAVSNGAKVINLSLGSAPPCSSTDPEYLAVENAIKSGVVVVAASGNGVGTPGIGQGYLDCPAQDPGVIAVGASALDDSAYPAIREYVASYSNFIGSHGTSTNGAFLVAPGGDPKSCEQTGACSVDSLHWIQNIYSTTAYDASSNQSCDGGHDSFGESGDCTILIAGTSMSAPHVAGVAALMRGLKPSLTPAQIAAGLCATADDIADAKEGCGRLNAAAAIAWARSQP